ncbi:LysR family transcriptional regulator [Mesorhizobium xinjiangense]|uniref:LysR family transcriptional regulator n=1 Tax=Mesorhizobium xinjiangense TaxID=2678685 RepID=UPI001F1C35BE|nr:LysR family transcriptional regulator [Mesorhizobium xinjiangense]
MGYRIPLVALMQAAAVAEHLNFRHAAAALGVSQSGLSQRIKQLEEDLGVLLFERRHRGVTVTEAGERFLRDVAVGIGQLDHAVKMAGMVAGGELGRLRIGLVGVLISHALADLLARFRDSYPRIAVEITDGQRGDMLRQIREGKLDIAFVIGAAIVPDCHSRQLWMEQLVAALPAHHDLAKEQELDWVDLASETFLVRHDGMEPQVLDRVLHRFSERGLQPDIHRFNVGRDTLMRLVAEGYGIALVPESATAIAIPRVEFRNLDDEPPDSIPVTAIWSPFNRNVPHRNFLDMMLRRCRNGAASIRN